MKSNSSNIGYEYNIALAKLLFDSFEKALSDKGQYHCYHEAYSHIFFKRTVRSFLEIGLFLSDHVPTTDLHAWADVFPDAKIYGADRKKHLLFNTEKISTFYVDQDSKESLEELKKNLPGKVDAILDDASHMFDKSINTFESMYETVADGGVYMIEDILVNRTGADWEKHAQGAEQLIDYFSKSGLDYELFYTSATHRVGDSAVIAIYK